MDIKKIKQQALTMLKAGLSIEEVAKNLLVNKPLVTEWYNSIKDDLPDRTVHEVMLASKVAEVLLVDPDKGSLSKLENLLLLKALDIVELTKSDKMEDPEYARGLFVATEIVTKLQNSFFKTAMNIQLPQQNTQTNRFEGLLKA